MEDENILLNSHLVKCRTPEQNAESVSAIIKVYKTGRTIAVCPRVVDGGRICMHKGLDCPYYSSRNGN